MTLIGAVEIENTHGDGENDEVLDDEIDGVGGIGDRHLPRTLDDVPTRGIRVLYNSGRRATSSRSVDYIANHASKETVCDSLMKFSTKKKWHKYATSNHYPSNTSQMQRLWQGEHGMWPRSGGWTVRWISILPSITIY
ncbi:Uncharacterized protein Fot_48737 [Forsythia ovata]|uniref:Uncharacterized protein n=1 Tax=Forsythia ovata TaxID=205694 RepID=A0ABD1Q9V5_9LAMI